MHNSKCELYDRDCCNCMECDVCDLNPEKICDNCCECVKFEDVASIKIEKIIE